MKRAPRVLAAVLVVYAIVVGGSGLWAMMQLDQVSCPSNGSVVVVDVKRRTLCLCAKGELQGAYRVALGRGGLGKRAQGDNKTPVGSYSLLDARPSARFGLFLPVGYPTAEQAKLGYSGSDIGVHGPHRAFAVLRHATVLFNWTAGCIAVGTQSDIEAIAGWARATGSHEIIIIP